MDIYIQYKKGTIKLIYLNGKLMVEKFPLDMEQSEIDAIRKIMGKVNGAAPVGIGYVR